jgi:hypothetical protein
LKRKEEEKGERHKGTNSTVENSSIRGKCFGAEFFLKQDRKNSGN